MSTSSLRHHTRAVLTVNPPVRRLPVAAKAAATMIIILGAGQATGRFSLGVLASLGAFTVLYGPGTPPRHRFRLLTLIGTGLTASVALGAGIGTLGRPWLTVVGVTLTAGLATFVFTTLSVGPPGSYFPVLVQGVAALAVSSGAPPTRVIGAAAVGAVVAVAVGMSDLLFDPGAPVRERVDAAQQAVETLQEQVTSGRTEGLATTRQRAADALYTGWNVVIAARRPPGPFERLTEIQETYIAATAAAVDLELGLTRPDDGLPTRPAQVLRGASLGQPRATHLLRDAATWPSDVLLTVARSMLGTLIAGSVAASLDNVHAYWAMAFALLILQQRGPRHAQLVRTTQRLGGTVLGLLVFAVLVRLSPTGWWLVAVIAVLQFTVEMLVVRNYGLATVAITPLALTIGAHASGNASTQSLIADRVLDTLIGLSVALVLVLTVGRRTSVVLLRGAARRVVHGIDAVLADLATDRLDVAGRLEHRRRLVHDLIEAERVGAQSFADDPSEVAPYREMQQALGDLGHLVLGLAWHPNVTDARNLAASARRPLARILDHPVGAKRPARDIHDDVSAVRQVVVAWSPDPGDGPRTHTPR